MKELHDNKLIERLIEDNNLGEAYAQLCKNPDPQLLIKLGSTYKNKGDIEMASSCFVLVKNREPQNAQAFKEYGSCLRIQGKLEQAKEPLVTACLLAKEDASAYSELGEVYRQLKQFDKAKECLEKALNLNNNDYLANVSLGYLCKETNDLERANQYLSTAMTFNNEDASVLANIGHIFLLKSRRENSPVQANLFLNQAEKYLAKAITLDPKNTDAHAWRRSCFTKRT